MTKRSDLIGYRRTPRATRWKKGQTGNPKKIRPKVRKRLWRIIEETLATTIPVTEGGHQTLVPVFTGIAHQLWLKAKKGNRAAVKVLAKYEAFSKTKPDTRVIPDEEYDENAPNSFLEDLKKYSNDPPAAGTPAEKPPGADDPPKAG